MVGGEEAIKNWPRQPPILLATPVQGEVTKIAVCSVLPIFDRRVDFYGNSHSQVKYSIEYLTDKDIYIYIYVCIFQISFPFRLAPLFECNCQSCTSRTLINIHRTSFWQSRSRHV